MQDRETWQRYVPLGVATVSQYGGKILVAAGPGMQQPVDIEQTPQHEVTVLLEFASQPYLEQWYRSPEYQAVVGMRISLTDGWRLGWMGAYFNLDDGTLRCVPADPKLVAQIAGLHVNAVVARSRAPSAS